MVKQLFLIRHAESKNKDNSQPLTEVGIGQCHSISAKIKELLNSSDIEIAHSTRKNATETAEIIKNNLKVEKSWSCDELITDIKYYADYNNFHKIITNCKSEVLIIVSHLEYVWFYPEHIGLKSISADYCEGILLEDEKHTILTINHKAAK